MAARARPRDRAVTPAAARGACRARSPTSTKRKRAEAALAEREQRFRDVVDASGEYVWETDARVALHLPFGARRGGARLPARRAARAQAAAISCRSASRARSTTGSPARAAEGAPFRDLLHRMITKSGGVIWQSVSGVPVRDAAGKLLGWRGTGADVTARKHAEARIEQLTTRDALTGLPNSHAARRPREPGDPHRGAQPLAVRAALHRPRPLQAGERVARPPRRRRAAARGGRAPGQHACTATTRWRAWAATTSSCCSRSSSVEDAAALAQRLLGVLARPFTVEGKTLNVARLDRHQPLSRTTGATSSSC